MILIGIGILIVAASIYLFQQQPNQSPEAVRPTPAPSTLPLYAIGVLLCLASFYLFYYAGFQTQWAAISYFVFSVVLFIGAIKSFRAAYQADQKEAQDMKSRADTHASRVEFERHDVVLDTVRDEAVRDAMMRRVSQELELLKIEVQKRMVPVEQQTQFMQHQLQQREMVLRQQYIEPARQQGISVDQYMAINEHWNRELIDFEIMKRGKELALKMALESEDEVTRMQLNERLLGHAQEVINKYSSFRHSYMYDPTDYNDLMMELYGAYGSALMEEYSGRGIIQAEKAQELARYFQHKGHRPDYQIAGTAS